MENIPVPARAGQQTGALVFLSAVGVGIGLLKFLQRGHWMLGASVVPFAEEIRFLVAFPEAMSVSGLRQAYSPVSMAYLEGVLVEAVAWACVNRIPSFAKRFTLGVCTRVAP